jgi:hypothetical protein
MTAIGVGLVALVILISMELIGLAEKINLSSIVARRCVRCFTCSILVVLISTGWVIGSAVSEANTLDAIKNIHGVSINMESSKP